jgi:purine-binding chemotaxis protein CheW
LDLAKIRKKAKASPNRPKAPEEESAVPSSPRAEAPAAPPQTGKPPEAEAAKPSPPAEPPVPPQREEGRSDSLERGKATASGGEKLLIFDVAGEKYAVPIHDIAQIIETPPTTPIPNAPPFLFGILSLRGKIVSVIHVAARLGIRRQADGGQSKVVVLDLGPDQIGLLVDNIDQVVEVDLSSLEPPPEGFRKLAKDYVEGVFHHRNSAVAFLNLPMFLALDL